MAILVSYRFASLVLLACLVNVIVIATHGKLAPELSRTCLILLNANLWQYGAVEFAVGCSQLLVVHELLWCVLLGV